MKEWVYGNPNSVGQRPRNLSACLYSLLVLVQELWLDSRGNVQTSESGFLFLSQGRFKRGSLQKRDGIISQSCGGFPHYIEAKGCFHFEYSSLPESEIQVNWRVNVRWKKRSPPCPPAAVCKNRLFLLISWFSYSHSVHKNRFDFLRIKRTMKAEPLSLEQDSSLQGCCILWTPMTLSQRERCLMSFFFLFTL